MYNPNKLFTGEPTNLTEENLEAISHESKLNQQIVKLDLELNLLDIEDFSEQFRSKYLINLDLLKKELTGTENITNQEADEFLNKQEAFLRDKIKNSAKLNPNLASFLIANLIKLKQAVGENWDKEFLEFEKLNKKAAFSDQLSPANLLPEAITIGVLKRNLEKDILPDTKLLTNNLRNNPRLIEDCTFLSNSDDLVHNLDGYSKNDQTLIKEKFNQARAEFYSEMIINKIAAGNKPEKILSKLSNLNLETAFKLINAGHAKEVDNCERSFNKEVALPVKLSELFFVKDNLKEIEELDSEAAAKLFYEKIKNEHVDWKDEQNITGPFESGAKLFGYQRLFKYLDRTTLTRHDGLHNFRKIIELAKASNLKPLEFYSNILEQVASDDSEYSDGTAHHHLNSLANNIDLDFDNIISKAKTYSNINKLQVLIKDLADPKTIFSSWKYLKKYAEVCELLKRRELLEKLQVLKKENKEKLYNYIETLAFHPNISMEKVMQFWQDPEDFLELSDSHTPEVVHNRKKPSNYVEFPNLDLSAEDLRDALVDGNYNELQVIRPFEIKYQVAKGESEYSKKSLPELLIIALGQRQNGIKGKAQNPGLLYKKLNSLFSANNIKLNSANKDNQVLGFLDLAGKNDNDVKEFLIAGGLGEKEGSKFLAEINNLVKDEKIGLKDNTEAEEYLVKINSKDDPDGVVAGNDTACCMPFGSGKNNVYTFNPICSLLTVQKKVEGNKYRTVAQSVVTKNKDIKETVSELVKALNQTNIKLHELINEDLLIEQPSIVTCDNIELAENFKNNPRKDQILKDLYTDFFQEYLEKYSNVDNLDKSKIIIGMGYTDALNNLSTVNNTFVPEAPVGYSDNLGSKSFILDIKKENNNLITKKKIIKISKIDESKNKINNLPTGIYPLTFEDSLQVAYIEGKAYQENESLIEYLHNMENALISKDVNNQIKNRPNMSFKYIDDKGKMHGYILAYEGRKNKTGKNVVYVSDLASDKNIRAGGSLILGFCSAYKQNYLEKNNLVPIYAQMREKTSYQIITKQLEKLTKNLGIKFKITELDSYKTGADTMHEVMIEPAR